MQPHYSSGWFTTVRWFSVPCSSVVGRILACSSLNQQHTARNNTPGHTNKAAQKSSGPSLAPMTAWPLSQAACAGIQPAQQPPLVIRVQQASPPRLCYGHAPHTRRLHARWTAAMRASSTADSGCDQQQQQHQQQLQQQQQQAGGHSSSRQQQQAAAGESAAVLLKHRLSECPVCGGTGRTACKDCSGAGFLPRGGYSKKNPLNTSRAVGKLQHQPQLPGRTGFASCAYVAPPCQTAHVSTLPGPSACLCVFAQTLQVQSGQR